MPDRLAGRLARPVGVRQGAASEANVSDTPATITVTIPADTERVYLPIYELDPLGELVAREWISMSRAGFLAALPYPGDGCLDDEEGV